MARTRSPARLVIALSIASLLAVFLIYTAVAGGSTLVIKPTEAAAHVGNVQLEGIAVGPITGDSHSPGGLRFHIRDLGKKTNVRPLAVVFHGSIPDLFGPGKSILLGGALQGGTFVATNLVTKCPSHYTATKA